MITLSMYQIEAWIVICLFQFVDVESRSCPVIKRDPLQLDKNMYTLVLSEINGRAELPCITLKEDNESNIQDRRWMKRLLGAKKWNHVKIENNIKINECSSLVFESCRKEDIALYGCFSKNDASMLMNAANNHLFKFFIKILFLDLVGPRQVVFSNFTSKTWRDLNNIYARISKPIDIVNETFLKDVRATLKYLPEPWGPCYPCGLNKIAYRQRMIRCLVARIEKINAKDKPHLMHIPIFGCHSWFVDDITPRLELMEQMPNFLDIEQCTSELCVEDKIKKDQSIINFDLESFLSSLKIKPNKSEQSKVIVPIELPKGRYFEFEGWRIEIKCPNVKKKVKVYWYKDNQLIELKNERRRRIYQNKKSELVFKNLESNDSGVYTCVQNNVQKASSELIVKSYSNKYDLRNPLVAMISMTILITVCFLSLIICKIFLYHKGYERLINVRSF